jgi:type IV pilus assembly protein PilB
MRFDKKMNKPLGQILVERGLITKLQLDEALKVQKTTGGLIGEIIVQLGYAKKEDIDLGLSLQSGRLFGQILIERGIITTVQLDEILKVQADTGGLIGEIAVRLGYATEEDIAHCLSLQFGFPYLPLENYEISEEVVKLVAKNIATHYCLVPIDRIGNTLTIAMANPLNVHAIEDLEDITRCEIQIFVGTPSDIRATIDKFYNK